MSYVVPRYVYETPAEHRCICCGRPFTLYLGDVWNGAQTRYCSLRCQEQTEAMYSRMEKRLGEMVTR